MVDKLLDVLRFFLHGFGRMFGRFFGVFSGMFSRPETSTHDSLGAYPAKLDVPVMPERRYLKATRTMALATYVLMFISALLAWTVYIVVPMQSSRPVLYKYNKAMIRIEAIERNESVKMALDLEAERLLIKYVEARNTFLADPFERRRAEGGVRFVKQLMGGEEEQEMYDKEMRAFVSEQRAAPFDRRATVTRVSRFDRSRWIIDYETRDRYTRDDMSDRPERVTRWRAYVAAGFAAGGAGVSISADNPQGFRVVRYLVAAMQ